MFWDRIFIDGATTCVLFGSVLVVSMMYNPRIWLHDMPADIQALVPPKTEQEKRQTSIFGIPLIAIMLAYPVLSALVGESQHGAQLSFLQAFLHVYSVFMFFNVFDWLVIDWGTVFFWKPEWELYPGTRGAAGYKDYAFHFRGFLKGSVMGVLLSVLMAGVVVIF